MAKFDWRNAKKYLGGTEQVKLDEKKRPDGYWNPENAAPRTTIRRYITLGKSKVYHLAFSSNVLKTVCKAENGWGKKPKIVTEHRPEGKALCTMCEIVAEKKGYIYE